MWKLLENIGLGLFVNATYSLVTTLKMELPALIVLTFSVVLMGFSIFLQRRKNGN